jgi:hypothetical protein
LFPIERLSCVYLHCSSGSDSPSIESWERFAGEIEARNWEDRTEKNRFFASIGALSLFLCVSPCFLGWIVANLGIEAHETLDRVNQRWRTSVGVILSGCRELVHSSSANLMAIVIGFERVFKVAVNGFVNSDVFVCIFIFKCWALVPHIREWLSKKGLNESEAYEYFVLRV